MKVAMSCGQVQPVWAGNIPILRNQNAVFMHPLQVRICLRYATANNEDGALVNVYASGFWGGKQTCEGIF